MTACNQQIENPRGGGLGLVESRMEQWLVSLLDGKNAALEGSQRSTSEVIEALGHFTWQKQAADMKAGHTPVSMAKGHAHAERARLKVTRHAKGIGIVRLLVSSLLRDSELDELAEALDCLVLSGVRRILVDFGPVEKMSSQVVAHLAALQKQCAESSDGRLAMCGVRPALAELFEITGIGKVIPMYADERAAFAQPWAEAIGPAPLPVGLLKELRGRGVSSDASTGGQSPLSPLSQKGRGEHSEAWLVVLSGPRAGRGRAVRIGTAPVVIGRDADCAIRSEYPGLSRRHAQIERDGDDVVLRDLGSTNGTMVKGRLLKGEAAVLKDRARIAIGPLRFAVAIGRPARGPVRDETIVEWLRDPGEEAESTRREGDTRLDLPRFSGDVTATFDTLRAIVIDDVLVISPRKARLEGETLIEDLRRDLTAIADGPWPKRVVINLVGVDQISTQAVGLVVAHGLGLERQGGALRLCQINPRVLAVLERTRVTDILETHQSLDEAVLGKWAPSNEG